MGIVSELAQRRPRLFGGTVAATTGSLGDICAQRIAHKSDPDGPQEINPSRVFAMASFCATFASVVYVPFYRALDRFHGPARTLKNVLYKTAWNQLALSPFVDVPVYFAWSSYLDDDPDPWRRFRREYWDVLLGTWAVWVPVCFFNFSLMPLHFRVPVAYTAEGIWCCVMSYLSHRRPAELTDASCPAAATPAPADARRTEPEKPGNKS